MRWADLDDYFPDWAAYRRWYLRLPGAQLAVRRAGSLVADAAIGVADEQQGAPLTTAHLFRIASHSKTFAAVLVLQLVAQDRLRLDDRVGDLVPELAGAAIADRTVGELLSHSGGVIRDSIDGDFWQGHRPFPDRAELLDIARSPSAAVLDRNERFKYSNIGFGLLGLVIEAVTGASFAEQVSAQIATPLGLHDTGGEFDPERAHDYAAGHSSLATGRARSRIEHVDTRALAAATGCYSTARDLTAFYGALLPDDHRLLSADGQRLQRLRRWTIKKDAEFYGLGVFLDHVADTDLYGHTGGYPGHITCTYVDAVDGTVVSVLTNAIDGAASETASGYFRLRDLARRAEHRTCDEDAARFTGRFASLWRVQDVVRLGERLFSVAPTAPDPAEDAVPLEVVDDTTLRIIGGRGGNSVGELMRYEFDEHGSVRSLRADSGMTLTPFDTPPA